jgi:hypothetical protein
LAHRFDLASFRLKVKSQKHGAPRRTLPIADILH